MAKIPRNELLKALREGRTQSDIAKEYGVSRAAVSLAKRTLLDGLKPGESRPHRVKKEPLPRYQVVEGAVFWSFNPASARWTRSDAASPKVPQ